jgi:phosphoribosyl 1,2-cyclic phosphodiesterase
VLIDAGLSGKEIAARLEAIGERLEDINAVLVSHEHTDHTCGLTPVLRKSHATVYMTHLTAPCIEWGTCEPLVRCFQAGERIEIGDVAVESFTVPHDAVDPVGFRFCVDGVRIGFVTDLGYMPASVKFHLRCLDFLVLESNHDLDMLKVGPYPWSVKQRVMGRNGHLSNAMVSDFVECDLDCSVQTLVLGHLSEHNNHPAIVELSAMDALRRRGLFGTNVELAVTAPRSQSRVWEL